MTSQATTALATTGQVTTVMVGSTTGSIFDQSLTGTGLEISFQTAISVDDLESLKAQILAWLPADSMMIQGRSFEDILHFRISFENSRYSVLQSL
jgi:hypothetical protein